ncbi:MAG: DUF167 domain-containing protein [Candidatus Woesearchaeota archaeon]
MEINLYIENNDSIRLYVKPNSPKTMIIGYDESKQALKMDIAKPAENNKANIEIIKFFRKNYKKDIKIISGLKSKEKLIKML